MNRDVEVAKVSSVVFEFRPRSAKAKRWVRRNIAADALREGGAFLAENRQARDIAEDMRAHGLTMGPWDPSI